jgi:hypothetical protein
MAKVSLVQRSFLFPTVILVALAALVAAIFYRENFDDPVVFPFLGDRESAVECNAIDRDRLLVILAVGQSIASNYGDTPFRPDANVFSFYNGRCFKGADPLPGADGTGGSIWSRLGDRLVKAGYAKNVLLVAIGAGGSSISEWVPDAKYYPRLVDAASSLRAADLKPQMIVWQQGSRDRDMGAEKYKDYMNKFIYALPFLGLRLGQPARLLVATHTRCNNEAALDIQLAQQSFVAPEKYILAGPNTDTLTTDLKYDGCHYNDVGLKAASRLWFEAVLQAQAQSNWLPMAAKQAP